MNESIKQLLSLQDRDLELDKLKADVAAIPGKITALKGQIQAEKTALENAKKDLVTLQGTKKEHEANLDSQENAIRKHTGDLNAIKSNDAYKAMLGEIEKAKQTKSALEDQILQVMEQIDQANRVWKEKEVVSKKTESDLQQQISSWENKQKELEQQITVKQGEREQASGTLPKALGEQYGRLRAGRRGAAVVPIRNEQCSGCHMKVSPNLINEVRRGQKLMICESCSRIVYLEDTLAGAKPEGAPAAQ